MALSRRQRALEKLQAAKARKRMQVHRPTMKEGDPSDDVSEVDVVDSKSTEEDMKSPSSDHAIDHKYMDRMDDSPSSGDDDTSTTDNIEPDSPVPSRVDDHEQPKETEQCQETSDGSVPPPVIDTRQDIRSESRQMKSNGNGAISSSMNDESSVIHQTPKLLDKQNDDVKGSPLRRFDIVEGDITKRGNDSAKPRSASSSNKSVKARLSRKYRKSKKSRMKNHVTDDDTSSVDSRFESYFSEPKVDGLAGALDHVFNYFDDMRSFGDDSYSLRTEETVPITSLKSSGGFFRDVEEIFTERFSCGSLPLSCKDLTAPTFSFPEDESTISGIKERKRAVHSTKRPVRRSKKESSIELDSRSEFSSLIPEEDETITDTTATKEESHVESETATHDQEHEVSNRKSFDTQDGILCRSMCNIASDCLNKTPTVDEQGKTENLNKLQQLVLEAKRHAAQMKNNFKSDASFQSTQHSLKETSPFVPVMPHSKCDDNILVEENGSSNSFPINGGDATERNLSRTFLSKLVNITRTGSSDTQSVNGTQVNKPEDNHEQLVPKAESDILQNTELPSNEDYHEYNEMYAAGQTIKPSASFFSIDTRASRGGATKTHENAFQEALAKLRELESKLKAIKLTPEEHGWVLEKFKEFFACSADVNQDQTSGDQTEKVAKHVTFVEKFQFACSCRDIDRAESPTASPLVEPVDDKKVEAQQTLSSTAEKVDILFQSEENEKDIVGFSVNDDDPKFFQGDCNTSAENQSIDTKATSNSTEDEAELNWPELSDNFFEPENTPSHPVIQNTWNINDVAMNEKVQKKWGGIRQVSKMIRPFRKTKDSVGSTSRKSAKTSHVTARPLLDDENFLCTSNGAFSKESCSQEECFVNPFHPSVSVKTKRDAWRSTQVDGFVEIISASARADDWNQIVPELTQSSSMDSMTKASF